MGKDLFTILKRRINRIFYLDLNKDYKNSILLVGTGRSGTTWLSDIINYKNEYRYMFEPFHPAKVRLAKVFGNRKYLNENNNEPKYLEAAKKIFSGDIRNFWIDNFNTTHIANKRLIKDIRVSLMLRWIHKNFPLMPIICLIRHPIPTALSHIKFNLKADLDVFLNQEDLISDYLLPFHKSIKSSMSANDFEKHIFFWCIENYVLLKQIEDTDIQLVFYEDLCTKPEEEIKKIFSYLDKEFNDEVLKVALRSSSLSRDWSAVNKGADLINSWKKEVTNDQINKANEIFKIFRLEKVYNNELLCCNNI